MEPQFVNGQTVWVHAQKELDDGEIGIFFHNGEGFIKKLGYKDGKIFLISLNHRKYEPREIKEGDVFFVFGKVVG
jgi:repressor LexA